jgi:hypothetical protein
MVAACKSDDGGKSQAIPTVTGTANFKGATNVSIDMDFDDDVPPKTEGRHLTVWGASSNPVPEVDPTFDDDVALPYPIEKTDTRRAGADHFHLRYRLDLVDAQSQPIGSYTFQSTLAVNEGGATAIEDEAWILIPQPSVTATVRLGRAKTVPVEVRIDKHCPPWVSVARVEVAAASYSRDLDHSVIYEAPNPHLPLLLTGESGSRSTNWPYYHLRVVIVLRDHQGYESHLVCRAMLDEDAVYELGERHWSVEPTKMNEAQE